MREKGRGEGCGRWKTKRRTGQGGAMARRGKGAGEQGMTNEGVRHERDNKYGRNGARVPRGGEGTGRWEFLATASDADLFHFFTFTKFKHASRPRTVA